MQPARRLPIGAEVIAGKGVHFRVWAPKRRRVEVVLEESGGTAVGLESEGSGYFSAWAKQAAAGTRYRFRLDGGQDLFPDPAARFQPEGPHGPSEVIDAGTFGWTDQNWRGCGLAGQVIYEMHLGTFTPEGTYAAAAEQLRELAEVGITVLEVMPVAEFPGRFGWGYDGVDLFAPTRLYGRPDDFRHFVDRAHADGLGVILDVVYNHIGPDGNFLKQFADDYFTDRYKNEWGEAINFDGDNAGPVREFFAANAGYWVDEFHLDGLRLDATQQIFDRSEEHILRVIGRRVREAARGRATVIVGENEPQHTRLVRPVDQGGYGLDALWNDDFHHSARVAMTGHNPAYYTDYRGTSQELLSAVKWGFLYQGQWYSWQKNRRGTSSLDLAPAHLVTFIQNHDQIANSGRGERCHRLTSPGRFKAMTALLLLGPQTPMLFQGQEFAASNPFHFFADHNPELAKLVAKGRAEFLAQFPSLAMPEMKSCLPDPADPRTFERCKLNFAERETNKEIYHMHCDLLRLRREDPVFRAANEAGLPLPSPPVLRGRGVGGEGVQNLGPKLGVPANAPAPLTPDPSPPEYRGRGEKRVDGAVLNRQALVLRYFADDGADRLLVVNLGTDLRFNPSPEPLLAPPGGHTWTILWSSEDVRYGGCATPPLDTEDSWRIPGEAAVVLVPLVTELT